MKTIQTNALFDVSEFSQLLSTGQCLVIGSYFKAIRKNFCTGQEYIGPWVNWRRHADFQYTFTYLPMYERRLFTEDDECGYVHANDWLPN